MIVFISHHLEKETFLEIAFKIKCRYKKNRNPRSVKKAGFFLRSYLKIHSSRLSNFSNLDFTMPCQQRNDGKKVPHSLQLAISTNSIKCDASLVVN